MKKIFATFAFAALFLLLDVSAVSIKDCRKDLSMKLLAQAKSKEEALVNHLAQTSDEDFTSLDLSNIDELTLSAESKVPGEEELIDDGVNINGHSLNLKVSADVQAELENLKGQD